MKRLSLPAGAIARARRLRRDRTEAEDRLWYALRETLPAIKFRHQVPFGPYTADFASHSARLIIEVDGGQHAEARRYDAERTGFLEGEGYSVLRFWNNDVLQNADGVLAVISEALSPCGRGLGEGPAASAADKAPAPPQKAPAAASSRHERFTPHHAQVRMSPGYPQPCRGHGVPGHPLPQGEREPFSPSARSL